MLETMDTFIIFSFSLTFCVKVSMVTIGKTTTNKIVSNVMRFNQCGCVRWRAENVNGYLDDLLLLILSVLGLG